MITYSKDSKISANQLSDIFKSSGIKRPYNDIARLQKMLDQADLLITAWDQDKPVGVARALTDFSYCCYLSDLAVNDQYQKHGIGKQLISLVQEEIGQEVALLLLSAPNAMDYYPKIGFQTVKNGFIIPREK
ncbi:GNAT family N-acetyltransferase [Alkalihalobacillus trypoxylicola]|uniref:GCN5 family acetyltransferase n=1 Tax=Alkalihalobacillus trypoxylicola TaxID=519424 RepID=A0A161PB03_9BACI|nr:GNAT family N-acetyltransferase [Alkalihalobacillus trypoxylicola]KYG29372.1 GCN5 family acetyltransferase [Alkalihalobacillus trypoxylicola]